MTKGLLLFFALLFSVTLLGQAEKENTPAEIVEAQLVAYNVGDIDAFMAVFHDDISIWNFGDEKPRVEGFEQVKNIYAQLFEASPNLHSKVVNRTIIGNKVLDYEYISGRGGDKPPFFLIMVYEIKDNKIWKATAIRE
jgi:hypothetical protein